MSSATIQRPARQNTSGKMVQSRFTEWLRDQLLPLFLRFGANAQTRAYAHRVQWEQRVA